MLCSVSQQALDLITFSSTALKLQATCKGVLKSLLTIKCSSLPYALWHLTSAKTMKSSCFSFNEYPDTDSEGCLGGCAVEQQRRYIIFFAVEEAECFYDRRHPSWHHDSHHKARPSLIREGKFCPQSPRNACGLLDQFWNSPAPRQRRQVRWPNPRPYATGLSNYRFLASW